MFQYAPLHAKVEHEQARRLDAMTNTAVRGGVRMPQQTTPYGTHATKGDGGLGVASIPVERASAVARELLASLNGEEPESEVLRWARQVEVLAAQMGTGSARSCFAWAEEYLASYGLFLRDSREKLFSRFLDILALKDFPARQSLVGPGTAGGRQRCSRWRSGGPLAQILRQVWAEAEVADRGKPET